MNKKFRVIIILGLLLSFLLSCTSSPEKNISKIPESKISENKIRIALVNGNTESHISLSRSVMGIIGDRLNNSNRLEVVARGKSLEQILDELKLQYSDFFDESSVVELGQFRAPKYIMESYCSTLGGNATISIKLFDIGTTEVIYADSTTVKRKVVATGARSIADKFIKYTNNNEL